MGPIARWGCVCLFLVPAAGRAQESPAEKGPVNRLARETSPYLRQHAHNPVDWYPWCPEAFAKARKENKLIFLSVGYSACHWCHVMEKETFSNADVGKLLNASFICIKVDREERPDVDQVCQLAVQIFLQGQAGGWPLSVFLTPDCKPIAGSGAFLPPDDRVVQGQRLPGLKSFIRGVLDARRDHPKEIQEQSDQVSRTIAFALGHAARPAAPEPRRYLISAAVDAFRAEYDPDYGGFGNPKTVFRGPKFPNAPALNLMLQEASRQHSNDLLGVVTGTLDHMAAGGICDQIGGGFHRYCVERTWTVPHFEKMLSDNAQLVELYARAFERTKDARYRRVIEDALDFIGREMTAPNGGFYSALDADSEGEEGRFYLWTTADIDAALPNSGENALARTVFGIGDSPMLEGKYFILTLRGGNGSADVRLETVRHKLFAARAKRSRPFLDVKVVTAWNGQMIAAYAVAGRILTEPRYIQAGVRAANFVLANLRTIDGRLFRTFAAVPGETAKPSVIGYLDDYAFLVGGLLDLHDATGDPRWVREAKTLVDLMIRYFGDEGGAFYYTASDQQQLFARVVDMHDAAQPSGNSVAVRDLLRLAAKTGDAAYRSIAERVLRSLAAELEQNPTAMPAMASSLVQFLEEAPTQPPAQTSAGGAPKGSDSVVKATAVAEKNAQGKQTIKLVLAIDSKWHLYANPVGNPDLESNKTTLTVSGPAPLKNVKLEYPKGKLVKDPIVGDYQVYEGKIEIKAVVERASGDVGPLELTVKVSACNEKTCLQPAKIKLSVP